MALTFDHATKRIVVPQADAAPLTMQALINAIRDHEASERGIVEDVIADAAGKDSLGAGVATGITVALLSTWKLAFASGSYQAVLTGGNLADGLDRVENTGSPQVLLQSSAAATVVSGDGGTAPSSASIAAAVRAELAAELARLVELHKIHGLELGAPLVVSAATRSAGGINQSITEGATQTIVSRTA